MSYEIIEKLKKEIAGFKDEAEIKPIGHVIDVGDGVLKISGLKGAMSQEMLVVETEKEKVTVLALNLEEDTIGAIALGDYTHIKVGDEVTSTGKVLSINVGHELIGRVVNPLGEAADGKGKLFSSEGGSASGGSDSTKVASYLIEKKAPSVLERESVKIPLHTGIKAIDSMIPIGRGQRELIIGDRQTGKTSIALDAIINQKNDTGRKTPICIYVAIGQKESNVAKIVALLEEAGAMEYSVVVSAPASSPAAFWYLAPYAGCAIGEYFMDQGEDVLIIFDDLTKHASAYRQISLLLRRPPGREAYPGDIFYLHSRLLERSAKLSKEKGGGSMTALPIIETQLGDVSAYVPTNVISITDGQIYLEADLFYQGIRPAVNAGLSVSRVGSSAQTKAMKKVAGKLRLELAQFRELQAFVQFASDLDENTKKKIQRGQLITEILKQNDFAPLPFEQQTIVFYATLNGYFDDVAKEDIKKTEGLYLDYLIKLHNKDVLTPIRESGDLVPETENKLKKAIENFKASIAK
jgi:F-type H+-transporting ATPase subunit alpha